MGMFTCCIVLDSKSLFSALGLDQEVLGLSMATTHFQSTYKDGRVSCVYSNPDTEIMFRLYKTWRLLSVQLAVTIEISAFAPATVCDYSSMWSSEQTAVVSGTFH
jgi:hypothetical protein